MLKSKPQGNGIRKWGLWGWLDHKGGDSMIDISALIKEIAVRLQLEGAFHESASGHSTSKWDFPGS